MKQPEYSDYIALMVNVLGFDKTQDGEGVPPFLEALQTWDPALGPFNNWLGAYLRSHKLNLYAKEERNNIIVYTPNDLLETNGIMEQDPSPEHMYERRETLFLKISKLSNDAQGIVQTVYQGNFLKRSPRTKWNSPSTGTKTQIINDLKNYYIVDLDWSLFRFRKAVREIKKMLKNPDPIG